MSWSSSPRPQCVSRCCFRTCEPNRPVNCTERSNRPLLYEVHSPYRHWIFLDFISTTLLGPTKVPSRHGPLGCPFSLELHVQEGRTLRRQAPLIACGAVALVLAMTPKIGFIGRAMVSVRFLFPSRFPASDYKVVVAVALIIISADAWSRVATRSHGRPWIRVVLSGCVLIAGALLVPRTHAQPTRELWLLVVVVLASGALALTRPPVRVLHVCSSFWWWSMVYERSTIIVSEGLYLPGTSHRQHWPSTKSATCTFARFPGGWKAVKSRPARVPAAATAEPNASGWVADAYHEADYDPTVERSLWEAENNPAWSTLLLEPWHGYSFSCANVGCVNGAVRLPPPRTWQPSSEVQTLSYGDQRITYTVNTSKPVLMVENELSVRGWRANTSKIPACECRHSTACVAPVARSVQVHRFLPRTRSHVAGAGGSARSNRLVGLRFFDPP